MPRIYVASLSDYNAGHLHGRWIDLDGIDVEDVQAEIAEMLRGSKHPNVTVVCPQCDGSDADGHCETCKDTGKVPSAEEWAVHDYDDLPSAFGEHPDLKDVIKYAEMVDEHGDAWRAYVECIGANDPDEDDFNERFAGEADTEVEWCENFLEECGTLDSIPENLRSYFDHERYLRDMKLGGDVSFEHFDGTVYAFWG